MPSDESREKVSEVEEEAVAGRVERMVCADVEDCVRWWRLCLGSTGNEVMEKDRFVGVLLSLPLVSVVDMGTTSVMSARSTADVQWRQPPPPRSLAPYSLLSGKSSNPGPSGRRSVVST